MIIAELGGYIPVENPLNEGDQTKDCSAVGKLQHMMQWSKPEIFQVVRELSRIMTVGSLPTCIKAWREWCLIV